MGGKDGKAKKKKKKRKADSDLSEPEGSGEDEDSNPKPSKRGRKSNKGGAVEEAAPSKEESPEAQAMPTAQQVCEQWGLNDVDLEYSDADYSNLTTYKLFQQTFRPRIQAENPKVPMSKLMMLVAAKWRESTSLGPAVEEAEPDEEEQEQEEEEDDDEEEIPLAARGRKSRGRGSNRKSKKVEEDEFEYDDEEDSDDGQKRRGRPGKGKATKGKGKGKAVPKLKIKLGGGRKKRGEVSDSEEEEKPKGDSDQEFEDMLLEAEDTMTADDVAAIEEAKKKAKKKQGKAKMKIGNKNKKKGKKGKKEVQVEDHQEFCEVCQQGGEIILCDTCPKAYHLVCLDPELDEAPEGKWSCPHCVANGPENAEVDEEDEHMEFCRVCKEGGELLCCDSCPSAYHLKCLDPPLDEPPEESWTCPRCACEPLPGKVEKILTWRWKEDESAKDEEENKDEPVAGSSKMPSKKKIPAKVEREFFIKFKEQSFWHCSWVQEIQLDVFHTQTLRMYLRKNDMDEPPRFDEDGDDEMSSRRLKHHKKADDPYKLQERFFRYGIRPEWLQIHHVISKRQLRDGTYQYFIKWRELPYQDC